MGESRLRIILVYPELLGTYGDRGNATVLAYRANAIGSQAEIVEITAGQPIPIDGDIYLFGGGEDDPQNLAAAGMRASLRNLHEARAKGAVVFAICAGFQLIGSSYADASGNTLDGIGLIDAVTVAGAPRLIGEVVVEPDPTLRLGLVTGFENHGGRTTLGPDARPFGTVLQGGGNGVDGVDGAIATRLIASYLHGPILARNPALADLLLSWVLGTNPSVEIDVVNKLHQERLACGLLRGQKKKRYDRRLARG